MFDESNLHSLIDRESRERSISLGKLLRESLEAAADEKFSIRTASGPLSKEWREKLRHLAAIAEMQNDWNWFQHPPWSELKLLLVKETEFLAWLNAATAMVAEEDITEASPHRFTAPTLPPKPAKESHIDAAIGAEYDAAEQEGLKPPNLRELVTPVQKRLHAQGLHASGRQIQTLADAVKYQNRRRKPGVTVASEKKRQPPQ